METGQLCEKQTGNVVKISFQVLWHNPQAKRFLEEKLKDMKVNGELRAFEFGVPYLLRDFDKEINQILDSEVHVNRKYVKNTNEKDLTYRIWRVE